MSGIILKAISYSLYGEAAPYLRGIVENCERARRVYPGWVVYVWTDGTSPEEVLEECESLGAVVRRIERQNSDPMFLRLNIVLEADTFLVRDADCRLSRREAEAAQQWLDSGKPFHLMHDHRLHRYPIMGGMWGAHSASLPEGFLEAAQRPNPHGNDQHFLAQWLWHGYLAARPECYMHHHGSGWRCGHEIPFPTPRWQHQFVGDTYLRESFLEDIDHE